jgi:nicotinate-nucleotide adenylyltransferase
MYAILGGTFDPPHFGHLALANAAVEQLDVTEVRLVPAGDPWQKHGIEVSDARHRLAMTRLAAAEDERFVVDDIEIRREGPTYTIDTVEALGPGCILILGADAALGLPTWHRYEDLLDATDIAVVERPGIDVATVERTLGWQVHALSMPMMDVSGTQIRQYVKAGFSPRFLVPDPVADYILTNRLYR